MQIKDYKIGIKKRARIIALFKLVSLFGKINGSISRIAGYRELFRSAV